MAGGGGSCYPQSKSWIFQPCPLFPPTATKSQETCCSEVRPWDKQYFRTALVNQLLNSECAPPAPYSHKTGFQTSSQMSNGIGGNKKNAWKYSSSGTGDLIHHLKHIWENAPQVSMFLSAPASGRASSSLWPQQSVYLALGQVWGHRRVGFLSSPNILRLEGIWVAASPGG